MNAQREIDDEKPLDPETERVRKKLVKFGAVFMGLNMLALMAVLGAIVYKIGGLGDKKDQEAAVMSSVPLEPGFEQSVKLPSGTKILSASENAGRVVLNLRLSDGSTAIWFYELSSGQITGKLEIN